MVHEIKMKQHVNGRKYCIFTLTSKLMLKYINHLSHRPNNALLPSAVLMKVPKHKHPQKRNVTYIFKNKNQRMAK